VCGILGIIGNYEVVGDIYRGLLSLQHRGQDSAGIITYSDRFNIKKGNGLVSGIFNEKNLSYLRGNIGIGHVRYPTIGAGKAEDAQPFYVNTPFGIIMAHNGNVINYGVLKEELENVNRRHLNSRSDVEVILNVLANELEKRKKIDAESIFSAIKGVYKRVLGSYSVITYIRNVGFLAFRDPIGFKPLIFGQKGNNYIFASESVALDTLGYKRIRDVQPGEAIFIDKDGNVSSKILKKKEHKPCIFEWVYFARPDSIIDGISVYSARLRLGRKLAKIVKKANLKIDLVIPVPDTSRASAIALSEELKIPYREGLIKNRYIGRTFIMPKQVMRKMSIRMKLNPIEGEIKGKNILIVDDSIVRGNTSRQIIQLVKEAGAKKVFFASYSPPLRYPCIYGIDMQTRSEFIAKDRDVKDIEKEIGADKLIYQSYEGLIKGVSGRKDIKFCTACFNGKYPTPVDKATLKRIEEERKMEKGKD